MRNFDKKIFNLPTFMFLWSQYLHIWQIHWVFFLIFDGILTKTSQSSLYSPAFFKILKEPTLVKKPTILHMKALIFSCLDPEEWGRGIIIKAPRLPPVKKLYLFSLRSWRPSEVDEIKNECFISNLPISGSQKWLAFDYNVIKSWKNVRLKCINLSPRTLYSQKMMDHSQTFLVR